MGGHVVEVLKVSSKSNPNSVAGALAGVLRQTGAVEVQVVGAGALNQAIKAIAIARGFVAPSNLDLVCIPTFADILIDGQSRTAIRLAVEDRSRRKPEAVAPAEAHAPAADGRRRLGHAGTRVAAGAHRSPPRLPARPPPSPAVTLTARRGHRRGRRRAGGRPRRRRHQPGPGGRRRRPDGRRARPLQFRARPHLTDPAGSQATPAVGLGTRGRVVELADTLALGASASA